MPADNTPSPVPGRGALMISNWREMLNGQGIGGRMRSDYTEAIAGYLDYCRLNHQTVVVGSVRNFMADVGISWEWHWLFPSRQLLNDPRQP